MVAKSVDVALSADHHSKVRKREESSTKQWYSRERERESRDRTGYLEKEDGQIIGPFHFRKSCTLLERSAAPMGSTLDAPTDSPSLFTSSHFAMILSIFDHGQSIKEDSII